MATVGARAASAEEYVTDEMRRAFREDGVVHLKQLLEPTWLELIAMGIRRNVNAPGPWRKRHYEGTEREFYDDYCNYAAVPEYRMLLRDSSIPDVVADIMGTESLWLFYEQIFLKQGGLSRRTPWHQDLTYWCTAGTQLCGFWITLDPIPAAQSLEFVRGSHLGALYAGTNFDPNDETTPFYADWPRIPDIEAERGSFDIVSFEIEPGDVVMFHPATLHGGGASEGRRRTLSVRFFGSDVVYEQRPGRSEPPYPGLPATCTPGEPLRGSWFPQLLPRPTTPLW
jgi:ectoine hydroxylase-related dioxygenase (phytanoyl-CoA dioxygenase family)